MKRLFLCTMFFALTGLLFALMPGLSPDTAHSAGPDYDVEKIAKETNATFHSMGQGPAHKRYRPS